MKKLIDIKGLNYIFFKVEKEISVSDIEAVIMGKLEEHSHYELKYNKVFYTFLDSTKEYQVTYYKSEHQDDIPIVSAFDMKLKGNVVYIFDDFFTVTVKGRFYYYQKMSTELNIEDLIFYIEDRLKIKINEHQQFNINAMQNVTERLQYLGNNSSQGLTVYALFVLILLGIGTILFQYQCNESQQLQSYNHLKSEYMQLNQTAQPDYITETLDRIYKEVERLNLTLQNIFVKNGESNIEIRSSTKEVLLLFLNHNAQYVSNQTIEYHPKLSEYILHANIKVV